MEKEQYYGDGVITGYGTINGQLVLYFAQDFTVFWCFIRNACRKFKSNGYGGQNGAL
jgi:acetyl-CoA carboxylase carboxyltransferase component